MTRTLLIDADIVAYQSTAANERSYDWGDGVTSKVADLEAAQREAREQIENLMETLKASDFIVCLSDDLNNFRKRIYPDYKGNRTGQRPEHLYDLKDWLVETYPVDRRPWLEADDVMGILSTEPHKGDRIIVSQDKDMQTIPGLLYNPNRDSNGKVRTITPEAAERFLFWQTLTGDATDHYPGAPGCGPKTADAILDELKAWHASHREITRGKRKGEIVTEWSLDESDEDVWTRIVSAYAKAGQGEKEALAQINVARILKATDLDGTRVIPWAPTGN